MPCLEAVHHRLSALFTPPNDIVPMQYPMSQCGMPNASAASTRIKGVVRQIMGNGSGVAADVLIK
jgi:hypothetical protein